MSEKQPRVWWIKPATLEFDAIVIDAPPEVWQHKVLGDRIDRRYWKDFVKVVEVIPGEIDVEID